jgi:RimJ/RimL family protein N-acetyltransferase
MITGSKVRLCRKRLVNATNDYAWKTDPALAQLDASPPLTITFTEYLLSYASELRYAKPTKHEFAIETMDGEYIGNCAYYDIDKTKGEAEIGIMIGNRQYWDRGYGSDAVKALVSHVFSQVKLRRIHLKTLDSNKRAQKCFHKCGFTTCGHMVNNGHSFVLMELHRKQWQQNRDKNHKREAGYG